MTLPRQGAVVRALCVILGLLALPRGSAAQSMRGVLDRLFIFSEGSTPLFLAGSAGVPATEVHGNHFIPAESEANGSLLGFFQNSIASNIASFPLSSTVASQTFVFVGGVPSPTSTSFGPVFGERAQTVGRGRFNVGLNYSRLAFQQIRGTNLSELELTFVHENSNFPNCDLVFGGDCTQFGTPQFEHDLIELELDLDVTAEIYAFYASLGLANWLDLSFAIPIIHLGIDGRSEARIIPTTGGQPLHLFAGTPESAVLQANSSSSGNTTGLGDLAVRLKAQFLTSDVLDVAVLGEVRAPTGRSEDFLGTGETNLRGLLIASAAFDDFSPHVNFGYQLRQGELSQDAFEMVTGFDHRLAPWVTLAMDVLATLKVGDDPVSFPDPVEIGGAYRQTVEPTNIPDIPDHILDGSLGFKFRTDGGLVIVTNVLVPLNQGGLRPQLVPTIGLEYSR